jgi:subtilase-type serine protease
MSKNSRNLATMLRGGAAAVAIATAFAAASPSYAVVGNDNYSPTALRDTTNITGVGQMVIDEGNGYVGLCTVSLINPRTVIFAAHCVNDAPASSYGTVNGGTAIGFGFQSYNRTPLINWLNSGHTTSTTDYFYNATYVVYNEHSLDLGADWNFLQSDIAMAALDTPVTNVPTWTMLFSALTEATHATVVGYGNYGTGTDGYISLDFRRRIAENTISVLGSLDDVDGFLFGVSDGLPQNLYQIDFNDPNFDTAAANAYDFNIFHDAALQEEAITAPGDSGGPLIVDQLFSQPVIAAVLSGGSRYYSDQPSASYGTTSFYQPLYLFWDWIVANNPYKYVSAKAGDGLWTDANHWVVDLDPNYVTVVDGELVNALPTELAQGTPATDEVNTPKFGQICYYNDCVSIGENSNTSDIQAALESLSAKYSDDVSKVAIDTLISLADAQATVSSPSALTTAIQSTLAQYTAHAPVGTVLTGAALPGTSGFVPDDTDGNAAAGTPARYYDVTLSAAGTTTLDQGYVTIDRLTINGANTGLTINAGAAIGTYIDTTMYAGNFRVNGLYVSVGDFALMGGVLSGNGTVIAPATTAVLGAIAPGTVGTVGTLTHVGDVVLSSGSGLLIDAAPNANDLLDVYGTLSLGGTLVVTPISGFKPKWHQRLTVATADVIENSFNSVPDTITGVLYPVASTVNLSADGAAYQAEIVTFEAAPFSSVLSGGNPDQLSVGGLLDRARNGSYDGMSDLYDSVDPLIGDDLSNALQALAPNVTRAIPAVTEMLVSAQTGFLWQYLGAMNGSNEAHVAIQTDALKMAANTGNGSLTMRNILADLSDHLGGHQTVIASDATGGGGGAMPLPKGVGAFLMGQKLDGAVSLGGGSGKADVDGFLITVGADVPVTTDLRLGGTISVGDARADLRTQPAYTHTSSLQFAVYGQYLGEQGTFLNGFAGFGAQSIHTSRSVVISGTSFAIEGKTRGNSPFVGMQAGVAIEGVTSGLLKPAIGFQYGDAHVGGFTETGGTPALTMASFYRDTLNARLGFDADWKIKIDEIELRPQLHAFMVTRVGGSGHDINAAFATAGGTPASFEIAGSGEIWADLGLSVEADVYDSTVLSFHVNANPGNGAATYTAFGGALRIKL